MSGGALDSEPVTRGEGAQPLPCVQQDQPGPAPRDPAFPLSAASGRRGGLAAAWPERPGFLGLLRSPTVRESGEGKPGGEAERRAGALTVATPSPMAHLSPHQPRGPGRLVPAAGPQLLPVEGLGDTESLDKPEQEAPKGVRPRIGERAGLSWPPRAPHERRGVGGLWRTRRGRLPAHLGLPGLGHTRLS